MIIALAGFTTGTTTVLFGFGGGFVVVPFVYQLLVRQPPLASDADAYRRGHFNGGDDF